MGNKVRYVWDREEDTGLGPQGVPQFPLHLDLKNWSNKVSQAH